MKPLSREFLLSRGSCCNNGCMNCPYNMKERSLKNKLYIKALKDNVWDTYLDTKAGDWKKIYGEMSPIEQAAWKEKFDEVQEEFDSKRPE